MQCIVGSTWMASLSSLQVALLVAEILKQVASTKSTFWQWLRLITNRNLEGDVLCTKKISGPFKVSQSRGATALWLKDGLPHAWRSYWVVHLGALYLIAALRSFGK